MSEVKQGDLKNYNTGDLLTPFQKTGQQWDNPIGMWVAKAALWRQGFFCSAILSMVLLAVFLLLLFGPQQNVFVVSTTKNGFVKQVAVLKRGYYVTTQQYQTFLHSYLTLALRVGLNHQHHQQAGRFVHWFSSPAVLKTLQSTLLHHPVPLGGQRLIKVQRVEPMDHGQYRLTWQQAVLMPGQGQPKQWQSKQAVLTVVRGVPQTEAQVRANPLGMYVVAWHNIEREQHDAKTPTR